MSHGNSHKKTIGTILIAGFCLLSMSSSAEAFWGRHHRGHNHYRGHSHWNHGGYGFGSYGGYGIGGYGIGSFGIGSFGYGGYGIGGYGIGSYGGYGIGSYGGFGRHYRSYPLRHVNYYPSYYAAPYINYGCGYGYGGYYSANTVSGVQPFDAIAGNTYQSRTVQALAPTMTADAAAPRMQIATDDQRARNGEIELKINVPEDARVIINDRLTATVGSERSYIVRGAQRDVSYEFVVRVEVERNGRTNKETKRVELRGGQVTSLAFRVQPQSSPEIRADQLVNTKLRLRVPDDAKVYLAGNEMKQSSGLCVFETTKLAAGEELPDYNVRVTFMVDGNEKSLERQLTLVGGETQEFEFDAEQSTRLAVR